MESFSSSVGRSQTELARCVFVSTSDAKTLRELAEGARNAESFEEYNNEFLSKDSKAEFDKLCRLWNASASQAFQSLKELEVRTSDEETLRDTIIDLCKATFDANPVDVLARLKLFVDESFHQTLTRESVEAVLAESGINRREFSDLHSVRTAVEAITDACRSSLRTRLIGGVQTERDSISNILNRFHDTKESHNFILSGGAGVGKSAAILQIIDGIQDSDISILAFRLDRIAPVTTTRMLGQGLGLSESPALALAHVQKSDKPAVLIIDQLDAVSSVSGRRVDFLCTIEALISEIRGLRNTSIIHLVVCCRAFDIEHDHRIKQLLTEDAKSLNIENFGLEETKGILAREGVPVKHLSDRQVDLLRLPQNLSLFLSVSHASDSVPSFRTQKELFDSYWNYKRQRVLDRAGRDGNEWTSVINKVSDRMSELQQLSIPCEELDGVSSDCVEAMASEGVITKTSGRFSFGHESFFDYCYARAFIGSNESLCAFLEHDEQHLFRRAQARQVLAYLRESTPETYVREISAILASTKTRAHLKHMALALLFAFPDPSPDEWKIVEPYIESEVESIANEQRNHDRVASMVWRCFVRSSQYFKVADSEGKIVTWLHGNSDALVDTIVGYLRAHTDNHGSRIATLLSMFENAGEAWRLRLRFIMEWSGSDMSRPLFDLFLRLLDSGALDDARDRFASNGTFWCIHSQLEKTQPVWVCELAGRWLLRKLTVAQQRGLEAQEGGYGFLNDDFGVQSVYGAAQRAPIEFVSCVLPAMVRVAEFFAYDSTAESRNNLVFDRIWSYRYFSGHMGLSDAFQQGMALALKEVVKEDPNVAQLWLDKLESSRLETANWLLLNALEAGEEFLADRAIRLLIKEPHRLKCGITSGRYWTARKLIQSASRFCSEAVLERFCDQLLEYLWRSPELTLACSFKLSHGMDGSASYPLRQPLTLGFYCREVLPGFVLVWRPV